MVSLITGTWTLLIHVVGLWSPVLLRALSLACKSHYNSVSSTNKKKNVLKFLKRSCCRGTPSQNLSGTLSPSIGNLTNLQIV
jgi:hypothetical protein